MERRAVRGVDALEPPGERGPHRLRREPEDGLHRFRPLDGAVADVPVVDDVVHGAGDELIPFIAALEGPLDRRVSLGGVGEQVSDVATMISARIWTTDVRESSWNVGSGGPAAIDTRRAIPYAR